MGSVIDREWRRVRLVIAPTSPFAPHRRSNSDHAGKSTYSGEIDYRFLTFETGSRFQKRLPVFMFPFNILSYWYISHYALQQVIIIIIIIAMTMFMVLSS